MTVENSRFLKHKKTAILQFQEVKTRPSCLHRALVGWRAKGRDPAGGRRRPWRKSTPPSRHCKQQEHWHGGRLHRRLSQKGQGKMKTQQRPLQKEQRLGGKRKQNERGHAVLRQGSGVGVGTAPRPHQSGPDFQSEISNFCPEDKMPLKHPSEESNVTASAPWKGQWG